MDSQKKKAYSKSEPNINNNSSKRINNINNSLNDNSKKNSNLNRNMFEFIFVIGKGGFGKVWRVKEKKTKELYALKEMSKTKIIDKKSEKSINGEREFLSYLHHPFIVNMHYAFQDHDNLYLVMDLLTGGDLRYHCSRYRSFSEEQTRFFLACIIHSLSYIHKNNVIHRDIKPENLVLDDKGYVCLTDFGIAKKNMPDNSSETSGTPGYMCPEVMYGKNHSFPADYFSIGVIGYEFMMGKRPYRGRGRKEIKEQMISHQAKIEGDEIKKGWSLECVDFINGLLKRKEKSRLGSINGVKDLKQHPWMKYYPWKELTLKILPAPFIPENIDNFDKNYCESIEKISEETQLRYDDIIFTTHFSTAFNDFYYNKNEKKDLKTEEIDESIEEEDIYKDTISDNYKEKKIEYNSNKESNGETKNNNKSLIKISLKNSLKEDIKKINKEERNNINKNKNLNKSINNESFTHKSLSKLNTIKLKRSDKLENQLRFPKSNSDLNFICNRNKLNSLNQSISKLKNKIEEKKTLDNFLNIKRFHANNNTNNKIPNILNYNNKDKKERILMNPDKFNKVNSNTIRLKKPSQKVYNVNNKEDRNNNKINIYLSINMFNKMLSNHLVYNYNSNRNLGKERNAFQELLFKKNQLMLMENKKKALDIRYSRQGRLNNFSNEKNSQNNENTFIRSNSLRLLFNNHHFYYGKSKNNLLKNNMTPNVFKYNNNSYNKKNNSDFLHFLK